MSALTPLERYEYASLEERPPDTFRLVYLYPGNKSDPIVCHVFETSQAENPVYTALSYLWGDQSHQCPIAVNGKELLIGASLLVFLYHLRHAEEVMTLWMDAVCINQHDLRERGHQVRLMGDIYGKARTVFSWLGPDTHDVSHLLVLNSRRALKTYKKEPEAGTTPSLMTDISSAIGSTAPSTIFSSRSSILDENSARQQDRTKQGRKRKWTKKFLNFIEPDCLLEEDDEEFVDVKDAIFKSEYEKLRQSENHIMLTFANLCQRKYWTRTWIVQELLLAQSVVICVGDVKILWEELSAVIEYCTNRWPQFVGWHLPEEMNLLQTFVDSMAIPASQRHTTLGTLLQRYSKQQCLDTRDRIFALLSLAKDCSDVIPTYEMNRLDLFFRMKDIVTNHSILRRSLDLPVEEVRYGAEIRGLTFKEIRGEIFVMARSNEFMFTGESLALAQPFLMLAEKSRMARRWAELPSDYLHWARTHRTLQLPGVVNRLLSGGNELLCYEGEIVQVRVNYDRYIDARRVKRENGDTGIVHIDNLELLDVKYTGRDHDVVDFEPLPPDNSDAFAFMPDCGF